MSDYVYDETDVPRAPKRVKEVEKPSHKPKRRPGVRADGLLPCKDFEAEGVCKYGAACKFSHLKEGEALSEEARAALQRKRRKRKAVCLAYQDTGECSYGDDCRYKHVKVDDSEKVSARIRNDRLIAECLSSQLTNDEQLQKIMALPEALRQTARAIFFKKQGNRKIGFVPGNKNADYRRKREQGDRPKISGRRTVTA